MTTVTLFRHAASSRPGGPTVHVLEQRQEVGGYRPLPDACVDDVPLMPAGETQQAALTFVPANGTTYFVQIGGFPFDLNWGSLHLRVR